MSADLIALQAEFAFFGLDKIDRAKPRWHSTGKLLRKFRPEVYRLAVELLGRDRHGRRELCELLHVSHHTLESIEQDQAETLATLRQKAARENMELHRMCLERAAELIPRCDDLQKVSVSSGIYAEKSQLFAGEATARIASSEPVDLVARFGAFVQELEKKVAARIQAAGEKPADAREIIWPATNKKTNASLQAAPSVQPDPPGRTQTDCESDGDTQAATAPANKQANKLSGLGPDPGEPADPEPERARAHPAPPLVARDAPAPPRAPGAGGVAAPRAQSMSDR